MRDEIFRRLTFGTKKTTRNLTTGNNDKDNSLRLRVLPENIRSELKTLRKKKNGSHILTESLKDEKQVEHEGIRMFSGDNAAGFVELTTKKDSINSAEFSVSNKEIQNRINEKVRQLRRLNHIYTWGEDIPEPFIDFDELHLPSLLQDSLREFGIVVPLMARHRDVLASAPTGSGKTLAFAIPIILDVLRLKKLNKYKDGSKLLAVVLEPTRELAAQTYRQFLKFGHGLPVKSVLFENEDIPKNSYLILVVLPYLVINSSGYFGFYSQSSYSPFGSHQTEIFEYVLRWLIVDESDRLFDAIEGQERCFRNQLARVYKACDGKFTRRAFFSATFSYEVENWCKANINNVAMVCIGERNSSNANVTQELVFAGSEYGKLLAIKTLFQTQFEPPALVFVQSKERARELLSVLSSLTPPIPVSFISSEKSKTERDEVIESFRSGRLWVLICTELMGRGLDLRNVNLVINFDLPTSIISYIHRIGRTGRAGRHGRAITYFTESDTKYLRPIATVIHQAGFEVPEYTLSLKPLSRNVKKQILRHAPRRKHIAFIRKKKKKCTHNKVIQGESEQTDVSNKNSEDNSNIKEDASGSNSVLTKRKTRRIEKKIKKLGRNKESSEAVVHPSPKKRRI
ncbi:helicase protein [Dictyocaulus viviparus]|uniref:ATP-dependent RNA helicase n=1 Tax=Dictyocaulus viviparus TaxID=29172 RepID=A0A0D8Y1L6_DICVI|nr:helicase protein [Dictyocaulus viviparus]